MPTVEIDLQSNYACVDCSAEDAIRTFIMCLQEHPVIAQRLDLVDIGADEPPAPGSSIPTLNLCELRHVASLIPLLSILEIHDLLVVPCSLCGHGYDVPHTPQPPATPLTCLVLSDISVSYPFDMCPFALIDIAPNLTSLRVSNIHALLSADEVSPNTIAMSHPQYQLPPPPALKKALESFEVTFPTSVDRSRWSMTTDWYDFAERLPSNRQTQTLRLTMIDRAAADAVASIVAEDAETLCALELGFQESIQGASAVIL